MATATAIDGTPTNGALPLIDALVGGSAWSDGDGGATVINIALMTGVNPYFEDVGPAFGVPWTTAETAALAAAAGAWEAVANVDFTAVAPLSADIWFWLTDNAGMVEAGLPSGTIEFSESPAGDEPRYGLFNTSADSWGRLGVGADGYAAILRGLGHALGLAYPHNGLVDAEATTFPGVNDPYDLGIGQFNQGIWTTMSFIMGFADYTYPTPTPTTYGNQAGPMALDIAAIQAIYGANMTTNTGANTYTLPTINGAGTFWTCIWDAGGTDRISNQGSSLGAYIDLRPAPLVGDNAGGYVSSNTGILGGFTIASGVVIENAVGGEGADYIVGNEANNFLEGRGGDDALEAIGNVEDLIDGGTGNDTAMFTFETLGVSGTLGAVIPSGIAESTFSIGGFSGGAVTLVNVENLVGGTGNDQFNGNSGNNLINGGVGYDLIQGGLGNDQLFGGSEADALFGNDGLDIIEGGAGSDSQSGGNGNDYVSYLFSNAGVTVNLATGVVSGGHATGDKVMVSIEHVMGSNHADTLIGSAVGNGFHGNDGADVITGAGGPDRFYYSDVNDSLANAAFRDRITDFVRGQDMIDMRSMDASTIQDGNNNFVWRGTGAITTSVVGEVRYQKVDQAGTANDFTIIWADVDNDTAAEFAITLNGLHNLTTADFLM